MEYMALYRKYRPARLSDLVGQQHVAKTLLNALENHRVAHAYIFTGPRGTGKTSAALIYEPRRQLPKPHAGGRALRPVRGLPANCARRFNGRFGNRRGQQPRYQ